MTTSMNDKSDDIPLDGEGWLLGLGKLPSQTFKLAERSIAELRCVFSTSHAVYPTLMTEILAIAEIEHAVRELSAAKSLGVAYTREIWMGNENALVLSTVLDSDSNMIFLLDYSSSRSSVNKIVDVRNLTTLVSY